MTQQDEVTIITSDERYTELYRMVNGEIMFRRSSDGRQMSVYEVEGGYTVIKGAGDIIADLSTAVVATFVAYDKRRAEREMAAAMEKLRIVPSCFYCGQPTENMPNILGVPQCGECR